MQINPTGCKFFIHKKKRYCHLLIRAYNKRICTPMDKKTIDKDVVDKADHGLSVGKKKDK